MPVVFKNPDLPDYFLDIPAVTARMRSHDITPVIQPFEAGQVITLSNLKFDIDHAFWAGLPTDDYPHLKKLTSRPENRGVDEQIDRKLASSEAPRKLQAQIKAQAARVFAQVLPIYEALFSGYRFTRRHAVWRLNTIMNENMHVDTYKEPQPDHFARMFINLDTQPRIWKTSWPIETLYSRFAAQVPDDVRASEDADAFRTQINREAYGGLSKVWWDNEPRHVVYFQPGDAWIVDSRQISHQIFYGRRALSIDFFVDPESMQRPEQHYLEMGRRLRREMSGQAAGGSGEA